MCTVTFIPTRSGFHLTSNRDEHISRGKAITPRVYKQSKSSLLFPKDPDKQGSWIVAKENGDVAVLLNGAFVKHERMAKYRMSRGLVVMDIINAEYPAYHYKVMDLSGVEPFTLVLYSAGKLYECRWDGTRKSIVQLSSKTPHIWSSSTLYNSQAARKRENWFSEWLIAAPGKGRKRIVDFHRKGGEGDLRDGLIINRDGSMKTMSITNVNMANGIATMNYIDLQDDKMVTAELPLSGNQAHKIVPPHFLALRSFLIRLFNWEYWPFNIVYLPVMYYWFWLSLKARSLFFFNTSNPLIENGGFAMESKKRIYDLIPQQYYPETSLFRTGTSVEEIMNAISQRMTFPLIVKPDIGGRGVQVKLVHNEEELAVYIQQIKVDFLVQAYVPYKNEVGIFYYRLPGEANGHVTGLVGKEFLKIRGDGHSTIQDLLIKEPRYLLQLNALMHSEGDRLHEILPAGKTLTLVPYGNHARGAKFIDLSHLISEKLTASFDKVCRQIPEFYFGRLDVMYDNWESLARGEDFSIIELNGAASEPAHIYDSGHSIFFAWREIIRHWRLLYQISKLNKEQQGLSYMSYKEGVDMLKQNTAYNKLVS